MPNEFIKTETSLDFLKDFMIETPTETIEKKEEEVKDAEKAKEELKDKFDSFKEREKPLEELQRELEEQDKPKDKESKEKKEESKEEETEEKVEEKKEEESEYSFKPFIETMAEAGVLDIPEGVELGDTAEDLVEAFETTVNTRIVNGINEYKESIPELGQQFLDYLERGGDPKKFLEAQASPIDFANIDLTDESTQKSIIREYLRSQDFTTEEIKDQLQDYEDGLLLEKQAKLAVKKLEKIQEKQTEVLIKQQEAEVKQRELAVTEYVSSVKKLIKDSTTIAGLQVQEAEKKQFEDYLFKRDKQGLTQYQKELNEDPIKTQAELAYLKFKKYDFAKVAKKAESTAAAKIRERVLSKTETTVKGDSALQNNKSDFSAFENMFKQIRKQN